MINLSIKMHFTCYWFKKSSNAAVWCTCYLRADVQVDCCRRTESILPSVHKRWPNVSLEAQSAFTFGKCQLLWITTVTELSRSVWYKYFTAQRRRFTLWLNVSLFLIFFFLSLWTDSQLDQLVIDSAMEKREMEHKHATIQQRVSPYFILFYLLLTK